MAQRLRLLIGRPEAAGQKAGENGTYRLRLVPDMAARVQRLKQPSRRFSKANVRFWHKARTAPLTVHRYVDQALANKLFIDFASWSQDYRSWRSYRGLPLTPLLIASL